ncbi:MAG TPA: bifunctional adenosylcobinamide kinase/adenosylcobinamide-phosphate guanylyltransferase [Oxalicibacterium sp.]|nr:bifunctional adenosylcobinamide kinase/adenosylcobinamide-phosphate guanylyltransferase [Oxalicibacterium sp.]
MTTTLIIGGARSGKSAHAEALAAGSGKRVVYIATAQPTDAEMAARIAHHQERRKAGWLTIEEPIALAAAITRHSSKDTVVLIDCLTVWLSNLLFAEHGKFPDIGPIEAPACVERECRDFLQALQHAAGDVIIVSNEVGQGIVPQGAIARWFVDEAGRLNQSVAAQCDRAILVVAGLPMVLKG